MTTGTGINSPAARKAAAAARRAAAGDTQGIPNTILHEIFRAGLGGLPKYPDPVCRAAAELVRDLGAMLVDNTRLDVSDMGREGLGRRLIDVVRGLPITPELAALLRQILEVPADRTVSRLALDAVASLGLDPARTVAVSHLASRLHIRTGRDSDVTISPYEKTDRPTIGGHITLPGDLRIMCRDSLFIFGDLSETILLALSGEPLSRLLAHPFLDDRDLVIDRVCNTQMAPPMRNGLTVTLVPGACTDLASLARTIRAEGASGVTI